MDQDRALELLDREEQEVRNCPCGAATVPVVRDDALWLECLELGQSKSAFRRLLTLDLESGHTRRLVAELATPDPAQSSR